MANMSPSTSRVHSRRWRCTNHLTGKSRQPTEANCRERETGRENAVRIYANMGTNMLGWWMSSASLTFSRRLERKFTHHSRIAWEPSERNSYLPHCLFPPPLTPVTAPVSHIIEPKLIDSKIGDCTDFDSRSLKTWLDLTRLCLRH